VLNSYRSLILKAIVLSVIVAVPPVFAELKTDTISTVPLPDSVPPIPEPGDKGARLWISKKNVSLFHEILLAPVASWLKDGKLIAPAVRHLYYQWELSPKWQEASKKNKSLFRLTETNDLVATSDNLAGLGYPFGLAGDLAEETDPIKRAYKILWNSSYAQVAVDRVSYEFELGWVGGRSLLRRASGIYMRAFDYLPSLQSESGGGESLSSSESFSQPGDYIWKEALRFLSPPVVYGYSAVTWRQRGLDEDRFWMNSPVTERVRKMLGSNRGDTILGGALSFDDLFVWSGKIQNVNARVVDEKVILAPFTRLSIAEAAKERRYVRYDERSDKEVPPPVEEGTIEVKTVYKRRNNIPVRALWNYETRQVPGGAPWAPSSISLVPRRVWILELSPRDPFYPTGKEILVIDKESMLPIYKVVYDRKGVYHKTVVGSWALAEEPEDAYRFPVLNFLLVVNQGNAPAAVFTTKNIQLFPDKDSMSARDLEAMFDLSAVETDKEKNSTSK
jgi:hypothetical protein